MVGPAFAVLLMVIAASGCSDDKSAAADRTPSADVLKKDCADPKWKEQNLGLWYSVCRQPLRW